jgi:hypothetical protein
MVDKENLQRQADGSQVEDVATLSCMTEFAGVTRGLMLLDLSGRMLRNVVEDTWERPDIPTASSSDNADMNT